MMRSLFSGVTGLRSHQTKMDVIGNNISNVNTLGYKKSVTNFADLYSQNMSIATGPSGDTGGVNARQIGLGTKVNSIVIKHSPGAAQYTGNTLDVAIEGDGFFILYTPDGERYSRAGDLAVDGAGFLVNQSGYKLMTYNANYVKGTEGRGKPAYIEGDKGNGIAYAYSDRNNMTGMTSGTYTFELAPKYTGDVITGYDVKMYRNGIEIQVPKEGALDKVQVVSVAAGPPEVETVITDGADISVAANTVGNYRMRIPGFGNIDITIDNTGGAAAKTVTYHDLIEQLGDTVNNGYITVSNNDGFMAGNKRGPMEISQDQYTNFAINEKGQLIAQLKEDMVIGGVKFAKNEQVVLGYLTMATFANNEGLEKVSTNLYRSSANSGTAQYGKPGDEGFGGLTPSSLEMSNVDLSEEMVGMITTQRGFQANSRIITTSDSLLEELVNLKR